MRRASTTRRSPATFSGLLALLLATVAAVAACAPAPASTGTPTPLQTATPPAASSPAASPIAGPSATAATSPGASGSAGVLVRDDSLLAILPARVGGVPVQSEPEGFSDAAADPAFVANVEAAAFATAVTGGDLASGVVARLRPGVFSEGFFRDWRDTYNQGACAQAGGIVGNAEAQLGGRTTYITSCAGGLRVYHAYLPERHVVVSLVSVGDLRLGEQLMAGLRP